MPPTRSEELVTTREFVTSSLFDVGISAGVKGRHFAVAVDGVPVGTGRLRVELPDKYPGQPIIGSARYSSLQGEVSARHEVGPLTARIGARLGRIMGWRDSASVRSTRAAVFIEFSTH